MTDAADERRRQAKVEIVKRLPRLGASAVIFFLVFTAIFALRSRKLSHALLDALVVEGCFVAAVLLFVSVIVFLATRSSARKQ